MFLSSLSCGLPSTQEVVSDYSQRVHKVASRHNHRPYQSSLAPYPRRRDIKLPDTVGNISFVEFLSLDQCGLQRLIADRNSVLGKQMLNSQRLLYEHKLSLTLETCINEQRNAKGIDKHFIKKLIKIKEAKATDLDIAYWNGTFASKEIHNHFSFSSGPLDINQHLNSQSQLSALRYLNDLSSTLGKFDSIISEEMEGHYQALSERHYGGELLQAMDLLAFHLYATANAVNETAHANDFCSDGKTREKAQILKNIFEKFYVGKIQPYLSRVHKESSIWLTIIEKMLGQHHTQSEILLNYYKKQLDPKQNTSAIARLTSANTDHINAWKKLFEKCNISIY